MKKEFITLDGDNNGFAILNIATNEYVTNKNGVVLFRNIELAKNYAAQVKHLTNPYDYDLYISLYGSMIPFDYFEMVDGEYQLFAECNDEPVKYFVKPITHKAIMKIGYIVTNNGEREFDKAKGIAKSNNIYNAVLAKLYEIVKVPTNDPGFVSITKDQFGICASLKHSTAKLHVCYNSQVMTINQLRKKNGLKALRFDKEMDKYTTLYTFIDIDISEPAWMNGVDNILNLMPAIAEYVETVEGISSCEYKEVELTNPIFLSK